MNALRHTLTLGALALLGALPLAASAQTTADAANAPVLTPQATDTTTGEATEATDPEATEPPITVLFPNMRPPDFRGLNVFEAPKAASRLVGTVPQLRIGGGFAQQFQALDHSNTALARWVPNTATPAPNDSVNVNQLMDIGPAFNLATANLTVNALLADGIQVNLDVYLSSRHHNETWVKGGYVQVDDLGFLGVPAIDRAMEFLTMRVGHFEVNYGDAHFRRTDNGNALYNPFVGNYILDSFTTEIGAELYARHAGFMAMVGTTNGLLNTSVVEDPNGRRFSYYGKLGVDRQVTDDLRVRLMTSAYANSDAGRSTLYGGDRAGSRYYLVMDNVQATPTANYTSGLINPGFSEEILAVQVNPFVKFRGLELFGVIERATGRSLQESTDIDRAWTQYAVDALYRFLPREQAYLGVRWNRVEGPLTGPATAGTPAGQPNILAAGDDVSITRFSVGAGWFTTRNMLLKVEYVRQSYDGFAPTDIRNGGEFNGFMVEGAITF